MADLDITGRVVFDASQAEGAFDRVADKAEQMANDVVKSSKGADDALNGMGDGANKNAEKFTRAESRISASIKRATNELELLGKTASQRLEFNIADKGLDAAKFEPALKKLREIEAQAMQAQRAATGSLDKMGISAAQTAAALRGVPAQFTDIVTSLQGGQAPLTVFLQQGGQLKDMFGGAGNAARALGGYVLGLVNPFTIAAAAAGALAFAYNQGSKEADAYNKALITTGNAAGTNAAQLKAYAQEISGIVGTQGKAAESLAALASTGKVGAESLRDAAKAAVEYERATGQAVGKTAEQFASLRNEPLAAVLKLNDGMNFLTDSTYKQIKSLEEQGRTAEAANVAQRAFADTLSSRAGEMERNLGSVERGWLKVKDAAKGAWDAILNVGRASTSVDQLADVRRQIAQRENQIANAGFATNEGGAAFGRPSLANTERLRAELSGLQAQAAALEGVAYASRTAAEEERKRGEAVKATAAFDKAGEKFLTDKAKMERELAAARVQGAEAGKTQAEVEQRLSEIRASYAKKGGNTVAAENKELREQEKLFAQINGVSSTYYAELANAQKQRAAGLITEQQYVEAVEQLIQKQPFAVAQAKDLAESEKERAKASAELTKTMDEYARAQAAGVSSAVIAAQQAEDQLAQYGLLKSEVQSLTLVYLEQSRESAALAGEDVENIDKRIAAQKRLIAATRGLEARQTADDAAKRAEDDWKRAAESIERSLTDGLMRGFESGKGFAENLRDTLKNMFNTLVLRPIISAALSPISGGITGMLSGGAGGAAGGGAGSLMNLASLGSSAYSLYSGGLAGWVGSGVGSIFGTAAGNAALGTTLGLGSSSSIAAANAASMAGGGSGVLGMGSAGTAGTSALAGAGAFAAVAAVVLNALGAFKSERKNGGGLMGTLGSGDISPWEEWREGGTLFSGPSFSTMNPVAELERQRNKLADLRASGGGNTQQAATLQTIIDNLEEQYGGLAEATAAQSKVIQSAFDAMRKSAGDMADTLGLSSEAARNFTTALGGEKGLALDGLKPEEQQAKLAEALATANNEIAQQLIGTWETTTTEINRIVSENLGSAGEDASIVYSTLTDSISKTRYVASEYAKEGEKAIDTLTRLSTSMGLVNETADALGIGMADASLAAAAAASNIIDAFGGLEAFTQTLGTYFSNFYSDTEQKAATARQVSRALGEAGFDIDASTLEGITRPAIRAFVESVGAQFGYESEQYVAAVQQANVLASITEALPSTAQALDNAAQDAQKAAEDAARAWQDITDALLGDRSSAEIDLLRAQGKEEAALAAERARAIVGFDAYQVSLFDGTQAIFRQIEALELQAEAAEKAREKALELSQALASELPGVLDKFRTPEQRTAAQYDSIAASLQTAGVATDVQNLAGLLAGASKTQIALAAIEIAGLADTSDEMRLAMVRAAGGLADMKDAAEALARAEEDRARKARQQAQNTAAGLVQGLLAGNAAERSVDFGVGVTQAERESVAGFVDQIQKAEDALAQVLGLGFDEVLSGYADEIRKITEGLRQQATDKIAADRLMGGDALGALAARLTGRMPSIADYMGGGGFDAAGFNNQLLQRRSEQAATLGRDASAEGLLVRDLGAVLSQLQQASGSALTGPGLAGVRAAQQAALGAWQSDSWNTTIGDFAQSMADAGLASIEYYWGKTGEIVRDQTQDLQTPLNAAAASIDRLRSASTAFGESAQAVIQGLNQSYLFGGNSSAGSDLARLQAVGGSARNATIVSEAAAIAAAVLTTSTAKQAQDQITGSAAFAGSSDVERRNASLLLDGIGAYDAAGFEAAFARINNALGTGKINEQQYLELFNVGLDMFRGELSDTASALEQMRKSAKSLADQLLIDAGRTTLDQGQTMAERMRQYNEAFAGAKSGDADAYSKFQEVLQGRLDKSLFSTSADYNQAFGESIRDLRQIEIMAPQRAPNADVVDELKAVRKELEAVRAELTGIKSGTINIVQNTRKTATAVNNMDQAGISVAP